jgi:hypothetical protein
VTFSVAIKSSSLHVSEPRISFKKLKTAAIGILGMTSRLHAEDAVGKDDLVVRRDFAILAL